MVDISFAFLIMLLELPTELHEKICQNLPCRDLFNLALVSKDLTDIATRCIPFNIQISQFSHLDNDFRKKCAHQVQTLEVLFDYYIPLDQFTGLVRLKQLTLHGCLLTCSQSKLLYPIAIKDLCPLLQNVTVIRASMTRIQDTITPLRKDKRTPKRISARMASNRGRTFIPSYMHLYLSSLRSRPALHSRFDLYPLCASADDGFIDDSGLIRHPLLLHS